MVEWIGEIPATALLPTGVPTAPGGGGFVSRARNRLPGGPRRLILLCQWLDLVVEIIGFFKKDSFLKNHVISIRYSSL
jgi:hypothetical protein